MGLEARVGVTDVLFFCWILYMIPWEYEPKKDGPANLDHTEARRGRPELEKGILIGMPATGLFSTCCLYSLQCYRKGAL